MRPLGSKSIATFSVFAILTAIAVSAHLIRRETFEALSRDAATIIGIFTVLVGTWLFRFFSLGTPSRTYFRLAFGGTRWEGEHAVIAGRRVAILQAETGRNPHADLPAPVMRGLSLVMCFIVSLLCFDARTADLVVASPRRLIYAGSQFCPPEKPDAETETKRPTVKPGCELIERAFRLGLVRSLGSCAPDDHEQKAEVCTRRQLDEPFLHYSARVFLSRLEEFRGRMKTDPAGRARKAFDHQLEHLQTLVDWQTHTVAGAPKASHHIFTNLPYPDGAFRHYWREWFEPNDCLRRYKKLPHSVQLEGGSQSDTAASQLFDHVYGQLLFNAKYEEVAGNCKEYTIHWNAPIDSCEKLARNPVGFLKSQGLANEVLDLLVRFDEKKEIRELQKEVADIEGVKLPDAITKPHAPREDNGELKPRAPVTPQAVVSFQCFMRAKVATKLYERFLSVDLAGNRFEVPSVVFPVETDAHHIHVDTYKYLASTLARGFHYTGYLSRSTGDVPAVNAAPVQPETVDGADFPLTRLENLKAADILLDNEWLQGREDLLEVYPYYHHLYHFVQLFRQQYRLQRTHL